jgi:paraquat-inducible protein A
MTQIACHECDLLLNLPVLTQGQRANCPRCNGLLCSNPSNGLERALAFAIAGLIFLILANLFPFLAFEASGRGQVMNLLQSSTALYNNRSDVLAAFVLMFIIIAPAILLMSIIWVLMPLILYNKRSYGAYWLGRHIFQASPWSMAEIFLMGALVSVTKIASMATIIIGPSFWSYIGFVICFTIAISNMDSFQFWQKLDTSQP